MAVVALVLTNGNGLDGAPVFREQTGEYQNFCSDEEPLNDYYVSGTVTFKSQKYHDYCINEYLYQHQCDTSASIGVTRPYQCLNGCKEGACIKA